jgi:hypothetical protein
MNGTAHPRRSSARGDALRALLLRLRSALPFLAGRWYLLIEILPPVVIVSVLRLVLAWQLPNLCSIDPGTVAAFSNSAIFVIALMLACVLTNYGEAEAIPGEIASELDALATKVDVAERRARKARAGLAGGGGSLGSGGAPPALDSRAVFGELVSFLEGVFAFLARERSGSAALAGVDGSAAAVALAIAGADAPGLEPGDALGHFDAVRKQLLRLHVIQRTDFLEAGYSLVDLFLFVTVSATVLCRFDNPFEAQVVVAFTALQFLYMKHLVHDIDAPFSYRADDRFY